eukprot:GHRQ01021025.1.p2 GENE.GHRQ01021025.1~~GHRQ01021025.1.p2  ORF type:complete len:133 (-),score=37.16 GHRQ01021025.1:255-653(-)
MYNHAPLPFSKTFLNLLAHAVFTQQRWFAAAMPCLPPQSKLVELKVDKAIDSVGRMASAPGADTHASRRISADLAVMRNAARLTRNSMRNLHVQQQSASGSVGGDVEDGARHQELEAASMHQSMAQVCMPNI